MADTNSSGEEEKRWLLVFRDELKGQGLNKKIADSFVAWVVAQKEVAVTGTVTSHNIQIDERPKADPAFKKVNNILETLELSEADLQKTAENFCGINSRWWKETDDKKFKAALSATKKKFDDEINSSRQERQNGHEQLGKPVAQQDPAFAIFVEKLEKAKLGIYTFEERTRDAQKFIGYIGIPFERFIWKDHYEQEKAATGFVEQQRKEYNDGNDKTFHQGERNREKNSEKLNIEHLSGRLSGAIVETKLELLRSTIGEVDATQVQVFAQCLRKGDPYAGEPDKNAGLFLNYVKRTGKTIEALAAMESYDLGKEVDEFCHVIGWGVINGLELGGTIKQAVGIYPEELKKDIALRKSKENATLKSEKVDTSGLLTETIRTETDKKTDAMPAGEKFGGDSEIAAAWRMRLEGTLRPSFGTGVYSIKQALVEYLDERKVGLEPFLMMEKKKIEETLSGFFEKWRGDRRDLISGIISANNAIEAKRKNGRFKPKEIVVDYNILNSLGRGKQRW